MVAIDELGGDRSRRRGAKGNTSYRELTETERLRYGAYIQSFFDNVESYRSLVIDHGLDKDLAVLTSIVSRRLQIPGFRQWWDENTADYDAGFVSWIAVAHPT